jgi:peptidoglycan hydrolase CwlO-like protein
MNERHHYNQTLDSLHSLIQPLNALVAHGRQVVAILDAEDARLVEAQRQVHEDRAAVEYDRSVIASRPGELEKAIAMQHTVKDLARQIEALETKRDHITAQLTELRHRVTQATQLSGPTA